MRTATILIAFALLATNNYHSCYCQWRVAALMVNYDDYSALIIYTTTANAEVLLVGFESGVQKSTDHGLTWVMRNTGIEGKITCFTRFSDTLLAGGRASGIYRSTNDGETWKRLANTLRNDSIRCLAVFRNRIYAGTDTRGVWVSSDGGSEWEHVSDGLGGATISALQVHNDELYCSVETPGALHRLTDSGVAWENVALLGTGYHIWSFLLTDSRWFVGTGGFRGGIYMSDDAGGTWRAPEGKQLLHICTNFLRHENSVYAVGAGIIQMFLYGIIRTIDNGDTWRTDSEGIWTRVHAMGVGKVNMIAISNIGFYYRPVSETTSIIHGDYAEHRNVIRSLGIRPNPIYDYLSIEISLARRTDVVLRISDLNGRVVLRKGPTSYDAGTHVMQYALSNQPSGIYICHVTAGNETASRAIVYRK